MRNMVYIDVLVFAIVGAVHSVAWWGGAHGHANTPDERRAATSALGTTIGAGITAVGILLPLSLVGAQIRSPSSGPLEHVFFADLWFSISLTLGIYALFVVGARSSGENPYNRRDVGIAYGLQLLALVIGVGRLLVGLSAILGGT